MALSYFPQGNPWIRGGGNDGAKFASGFSRNVDFGARGAMASNEPAGATASLAGAGNKTPNVGGEISTWVTSAEERFAAAPQVLWGPAPETPAANQIRLDPSKKFQEVLGFAGAFTDAACYMFNQLAPAAREHLFHEMFHPSGPWIISPVSSVVVRAALTRKAPPPICNTPALRIRTANRF